ncbi:MAG TPA: histidine--tRNA ligase [Tissierellaceae bacterium]
MTENKIKPSTIAGFMELLPEDQILFNDMMDTIKKNYELHGFVPINTPNIEWKEVLLAKGGGETAQQIYEIETEGTEMALRFDLTVPLAKYSTLYFSELTFPFRRYHIGKVYRGERNQRGRFREFYQCDVDIIGNGKLDIINDAEIPSVIYKTFKDLGFDSFTIKINNRKLLSGFFESLGINDSTYVLRSIDKLEKIGKDKVQKELMEQGLTEEDSLKVIDFINIKGTNQEIIEQLKELEVDSDLFKQGLNELEIVSNYIKEFGVSESNYEIDLTIARGLDYYTGTVYETILDDYKDVGSVCSGGRYDDLASNFTDLKMPGVGISIGLTRLFFQLREAGIIKPNTKTLSKALIIPMKGCMEAGVRTVNMIRSKNIPAQIYVENDKMGKKFGYADKLQIPYVVIIGESEIENNTYSLKNMLTGDQEEVSFDELIEKIK